jgi:hypothetical protein
MPFKVATDSCLLCQRAAHTIHMDKYLYWEVSDILPKPISSIRTMKISQSKNQYSPGILEFSLILYFNIISLIQHKPFVIFLKQRLDYSNNNI